MNDPTDRSQAEWQADLDRSEKQLAGGQTLSMAPSLAELDESIRRLEAKRKRDQVLELHKDEIRKKIAAGMTSLRAGEGTDGEAVFDRLDRVPGTQ